MQWVARPQCAAGVHEKSTCTVHGRLHGTTWFCVLCAVVQVPGREVFHLISILGQRGLFMRIADRTEVADDRSKLMEDRRSIRDTGMTAVNAGCSRHLGLQQTSTTVPLH